MCDHEWDKQSLSTRCIKCGWHQDSNGVATVDRPSVVRAKRFNKLKNTNGGCTT
jgi:hypothetical protein